MFNPRELKMMITYCDLHAKNSLSLKNYSRLNLCIVMFVKQLLNYVNFMISWKRISKFLFLSARCRFFNNYETSRGCDTSLLTYMVMFLLRPWLHDVRHANLLPDCARSYTSPHSSWHRSVNKKANSLSA